MRALTLALAVLAAVPVQAQLFPSDQALSILSLFGLTPHLAQDRAHFAFNITSGPGHTTETGLFEGLDGVPGMAEGGGWGVRPTLLMQGRFVGLNVSFEFDFPSEAALTDDVTYARSFGVTTRYHNGFNLAGFFSEDPPMMLTVGPLLHAQIGNVEELQHSDGSHAKWGHIGDVRLAPAVGVGLMDGPLRVYALGARYLEGAPWTVVTANTGEASGRWDLADPAAPQYDAGYVSAQESLQRIHATGGFLVEGGATLVLGDANTEPKLALVLAVARTHADYTAETSGFGLTDAFSTSDTRVMVTVGIAIPPGALQNGR